MVEMQEAIATVRQRRPFTIVGAVLALVVLGAFSLVVITSRGSGGTVAANTSTVVAATDLQSRTPISKDQLQVVQFPAEFVPAGAFANVKDVVGLVPVTDIRKGQPLTNNVVINASDLISGQEPAFLPIPKGFVAFTLPSGEQVGVAGYIQAGDYIDIIASGNTSKGAISKTIFTNVHVIRVGAATFDVKTGSTSGVTSIQSRPGGGSSLTVAVSQCQAEYLVLFMASSGLRYTLLSHSDYGPATTPDPPCKSGVTAADVLANFGFSP